MGDALSKIRSRRQEIADIRARLEAEDQELATAEKVLSRLAVAPSASPSSKGGPIVSESGLALEPLLRGITARPATHKELVIATLRASDDPWISSSSDLHKKIKEIHGVDINFYGTLLPLLSGLKKSGIVVRRGHALALKERMEDELKERTAEGSLPTAE